MHSISSNRSSRTSREISTRVLAGRLAPKYSLRTVLTFSRSATFLRNTVTLQTSANVAPAAARQRIRFSCTWRACATTSLPPTVRPCSSLATQPDTNTSRSARTTWVKWLMGSDIPATRISSRWAGMVILAFLDQGLDRFAHFLGGGLAAEIAGQDLALLDQALDGRYDRARSVRVAEMLDHHGAGPDLGDRVGGTLASDVRRRAVHGLEHRWEFLLRVDVAA